MKTKFNNDSIVLDKNAKVYLENSEEIQSIEISIFCPTNHPDPMVSFVTKNSFGEVRAWWTNKNWCKKFPTKRAFMLKFKNVEEAKNFVTSKRPAQYDESFTYEIETY